MTTDDKIILGGVLLFLAATWGKPIFGRVAGNALRAVLPPPPGTGQGKLGPREVQVAVVQSGLDAPVINSNTPAPAQAVNDPLREGTYPLIANRDAVW